jgi:ParB family transcriptional regulator, chromosome partitioning protein
MSTKRKALGKGLSALLESQETDITTKKSDSFGKGPLVGSVSLIPLSDIEANPFNPRSNFEEEALNELADSIREQGIIQPVTVRKLGYDKYQLISGERRFRASQLAGLTEIPAYIRVANDQSMVELALVENLQREDLDPIEVAISFKRLIEECNLTQEALSQKVSKQRSTIANYLRLLKLPADIQIGLRDQKITMGHARALINVENQVAQLAIYNTVVEQELSVRDTEELVRETAKEEFRQSDKTTIMVKKSLMKSNKSLSKPWQNLFNKKAEVRIAPNGKGKVIIPFSSEEELENFLKKMS